MNGTIVEHLSGARRVHIDSMTFIYFIEEHPRYVNVVESVFELVDAGELVGLSSYVTLLEVLVKPIQEKDAALAQKYREFLTGARNFALFPVDRGIAEDGAGIRARYGFRTPDAIQLATAVRHGADTFLTNDEKLKNFDQLEVVVLGDFRPSVGPGAEAAE